MKKTIFLKLILVLLLISTFITGCVSGTRALDPNVQNANIKIQESLSSEGILENTTQETAQITVKNNGKNTPAPSYDDIKEIKGLVILKEIDDSIISDLKYSTSDNSQIQIENLKCLKDSEQIVLVTAESSESTTALVCAYEKNNDKWKELSSSFQTKTGRKGFTYDKSEGDEKSPIGAFNLKTCYSRMENPGTKLEFIHFGENAFWVDDSRSKYYNTFQKGLPNGRWSSAEDLYKIGEIYKYFILVEYNTVNRISGKGSAIFMHIWENEGIGTSGCTSMAEDNLLRLIKWLDPQKKPRLIQGPLSEINKM